MELEVGRGEGVRIVGTTKDLSELQARKAALEEQLRRQRAGTDHGPDVPFLPPPTLHIGHTGETRHVTGLGGDFVHIPDARPPSVPASSQPASLPAPGGEGDAQVRGNATMTSAWQQVTALASPPAEGGFAGAVAPGIWTTESSDELLRKCHTEDDDSNADFPPETMLRHLHYCVQNHDSRVVFRHSTAAGNLQEMTFEQLGAKVRKCARALVQAGVGQHDIVCIVGAGSPTWAVVYLGAMSAGAIPCPLHATTGCDAVSMVRGCGARAVMTGDSDVANALMTRLDLLPTLSLVVLWEDDGAKSSQLVEPQIDRCKGSVPWLGAFLLQALMDMDASVESQEEQARRLKSVRPGCCASIALTAGCSGHPKYAMLSHDNWSWTAQAVVSQLALTAEDNLLACLPMGCAAAQLCYIHVALVSGCMVTFPSMQVLGRCVPGCKSWDDVYFAAAAGDSKVSAMQTKIIDLLINTRPTVLVGLGPMWEWIAAALRSELLVARGVGTVQTYSWALQQGIDAGKRLQGLGRAKAKSAQTCSKGKKWGVARRVMFAKIWSNLGLDRCRYAGGIGVYGNPDALELLLSVGIPVLWMYGSAECSGIVALSSSSKHQGGLPGFRIGYSGRALKGTVLSLRARTGLPDSRLHRIYVRGRNVMMGYLNDPAASADAFDKDGALRTGDCGEVDWGTQLLRVEAKEQDLIMLSTNKEFSACSVEDALRRELPMLSNVLAVGKGMPYVACLITLATSALEQNSKEVSLLPDAQRKLEQAGVICKTVEEARQNEALTALIVQGIQRVNASLGPGQPPVKRFLFLSEDLQVAELSSMRRPRRPTLYNKFSDTIKAIYDDAQSAESKSPLGDRALSPATPQADVPDNHDDTPVAMPRTRNAATPAHRVAQIGGLEGGVLSPSNVSVANVRAQLTSLPHHFGSPDAIFSSWNDLPARQAANHPALASGQGTDENLTRTHIRIEEAVLQANAAISNVIVVGEGRPFLACLISLKTVEHGDQTLHEDAIRAARAFDSRAQTVLEAKDDKRFRAFLVDSIARVNRMLQLPGPAIRKFIILLVDFLPVSAKSQGPSAITTPMRDSIKRRFSKIIDSIYFGASAPQTPSSSHLAGVVSTSLDQSSGFFSNLHGAGPRHGSAQEKLESHEKNSLDSSDLSSPARVNPVLSAAPSDSMPYYASSSPPKKLSHGNTGFFEELVQLVLDMDMADVLPRMQAFCAGIHADICRALNVNRDQVVVRAVTAGSVVVTIALQSREDDYRSPLLLVQLLVEQAEDMGSVLRHGAYTRTLLSLSHISPNIGSAFGSTNAVEGSETTGVGLVLQANDRGQIVISSVIPGTPAALTRELFESDIVIEVDGQSVVGAPGHNVVDALYGQKGSLVRIAVMRGDTYHSVYMARGAGRDSFKPGIHTGPLTTSQRSSLARPPSDRERRLSLSSCATPGSSISASLLERHRSLQVCGHSLRCSCIDLCRCVLTDSDYETGCEYGL